jgi:hypothetical protein
MHTAEPTVPEHSCFEAGNSIEKLKRYKSRGTEKIPPELIQSGSDILIHELINPIRNTEEPP